MRIVGLRISNFARFRGDHELDLAAGVHAIVATLASDPTRSNWLGKTAFLSAIRWALYGKLPDAWKTVDAAISDGESTMGVDVELSDGSFVSRTKARGQSAQLKLIVPSAKGERQLAQDDAQAEIARRLGATASDFDATVWMGQKSMARLLRMDPAERTTIVTEWFGLQKLVVAAEIVSRKLTETDRRYIEERTKLGVESDAAAGDRFALELAVAEASQALAKAKATVEANRAAREARTRWETASELVQRRTAAETDAAAIEKSMPEVVIAYNLATAAETVVRTEATWQMANRELSRLSKLAKGEFDGKCPVICGDCPVADRIVKERSSIRDALVAATKEEAEANRAYQKAVAEHRRLDEKRRVYVVWETKLKAAMTRLETLKADPACLTTLGPEPEDVSPDPDIAGLAAKDTLAKKALEDHDAAAWKAEQLRVEVDRIVRSREVLRIALQILGKGGAQRRIATRNLATIEKVANAILARAGVDLTVAIDYGRELQGAADVCGCGAAFPRTKTAKVCDRCGALRGKKRDERLYITTSATSGATEDLAGVAIQLAAARWRREVMGGEWSVVALDEPFGALDGHNRVAMARTLAALASDGFEQAFVVAHSSDVLEALPHRILITGDGKWSRVEVVR